MAGHVLVVGMLKGGVGKTRLAVLAALYLAQVHKRRVKLFDGDTVSQTAWYWYQDAQKEKGVTWPELVDVVRHPFPDINDEIEKAREQYDHVVCDIGGGNPSVFSSALEWANRLVVPIGADRSEIRRLKQTWKEAAAAGRGSSVGGFEAWVVLAKTDRRNRLPRDAREILLGRDGEPVYPLCDTEMRDLVDYSRAYPFVPTDFLDVPALLEEIGVIPAGTVQAAKKGKD
ncbi:hypothetical protein ACWC9S_27180 [Streptomyces xiamenensis]